MARRPLLAPTLLVLAVSVGLGAWMLRRTACAGPAPSPLAEPTPGSLRLAARQAGVTLGTALSWHAVQQDANYVPAMLRDFDAVTLENASKWGTVQHEEGAFDWSRADELVALADRHGLAVRGHPLVWDEHVPGWAVGLGPDAFREASDRFARKAVRRYRGRIGTWDVVNELIEDDGRPSEAPLFTKRGPGQAAAAFRLAREADGEARLVYNDDAIAWDNARSRGVAALVQAWKADGVPVDAVGMEMHLTAGRAPPQSTVQGRIRAFAALGVAVEITELDVRVGHLAGAERGRHIAQARAYYDAVRACVVEPACDRITFWGFTDAHSPWPTQDAPALLDADYAPKPAWRAVKAALEGRALPACSEDFVPNGTFTHGIGGWTGNGAVLEGRDGALVATGRADTWAGPELDLTDVLSEGVPWSFRARMKAGAGPLALTLRAERAGGETVHTALWKGAATGDWVPVDVTAALELPEDVTRVVVYAEGPAGGEELLLDDVSVGVACP